MKPRYVVALSLLAGLAFGAAAIQELHAQAKPPTYVILEIDVQQPEGYLEEFVPLAEKAVAESGGKFLARTGPAAVIEGTSPRRVAVIEYEDLDKARASFRTEAYRDAKRTGGKYATFRIYALEGRP